ncbi:hypothetical protein [Vibrio rumoiensis]|uniref:hypothetical protein n=1 Tax=Vibrio rumoiensis TaxID=76258 RepID=UPI003AA9729B
MTDERYKIEFDIHHNECLEKYQCIFWGRIDRLIIFLQIFLSTMVFADMSGTPYYGALMAALTIGAFVYSPSKKVTLADQQLEHYVRLRLHMTNLDDNELINRFEAVSQNDSEVMGVFFPAAYWRVAIREGLDTSKIPQLTIWQKFMAWLGGDLPTK